MNIVYGVSGEGLGHVFEAIEIATLLRADGHTVKLMTYGDRAFRSLEAFAPTRIEGVHLCFNDAGLSVARTLRENLRCFPFYLRNGSRLMRELGDFKPDVFITAYEPFTTVAAHLMRKPLISMDNQNELRHMPRPPEAGMFAFHLARLTTRVVTFGATEYIVKSFGLPQPQAKHVHIVSPIIQGEIRRLQPTNGSHILVYLTKPNPGLIEVFKSMDENFVVYCHNRVGVDRNVTFRAQGPTYVADLSSCKAIVGTTGFSLIADSIFLKKPYFGVPLKKQFEQTHNALFLKNSGLGDFAETVTKEDLSEFLGMLPEYRRRLVEYDLDPAEQEQTLRELLAKLAENSAGALEDGATATSPGA
jgi:uncharacterized protein (TIGR00661 family)